MADPVALKINSEDLWIYGNPDETDLKVENVDLIVSKKLWNEFLILMRQDKALAMEVLSSLVYGKLYAWVGPDADEAEPHIVNELLMAVRKKHSDAPSEGQKESE